MPVTSGKKKPSSPRKTTRVTTARKRPASSKKSSDTLLLILALGCCIAFFVWVFGLNDAPPKKPAPKPSAPAIQTPVKPVKPAPPPVITPDTSWQHDPKSKEPTTFELRILEMQLLEKPHAFGVQSLGVTANGTATFRRSGDSMLIHAIQQDGGRRAELKGRVLMASAESFHVDGVLKLAEYPEDTTEGYESRFTFKADKKRDAWVNNAPNRLEIKF